jgi:hypothetical protein
MGSMSPENSLNPGKGRTFQEAAREMLSKYFKCELHCDHPIRIGNPTKIHEFDLASSDLKYVGECKNYSWTRTGNIPSAKMAFLNEALLYLSHLSPQGVRFIVMRRDSHAKRPETLADYYSRTYRHFLSEIQLLEIDLESETIRRVRVDEVIPAHPTADEAEA